MTKVVPIRSKFLIGCYILSAVFSIITSIIYFNVELYLSLMYMVSSILFSICAFFEIKYPDFVVEEN